MGTLLGIDRVVPGSIGVEAERAGPGKFIHRGNVLRISLSSLGESRLSSTMEELKQFGFSAQFVPDEMKKYFGLSCLFWLRLR